MIGQLPTSLTVGGNQVPIETDYRNVLAAFEAFEDPELTESEKLYILMRRMFRGALDNIPREQMEEAARQVKWFIDCGQEEDSKRVPRKVIDWVQDEPILFPAINKVAGMETRAVPYIHWWTFFGYFTEIEEGTFSTVLGIRQKKAKGKKLEKWEQEFYRNNRKICDIKKRYTKEEQAEMEYLKKLLG